MRRIRSYATRAKVVGSGYYDADSAPDPLFP